MRALSNFAFALVLNDNGGAGIRRRDGQNKWCQATVSPFSSNGPVARVIRLARFAISVGFPFEILIHAPNSLPSIESNYFFAMTRTALTACR